MVAVCVSVVVTQVNPDGSQGPVDADLAAALAGPVEQFSSLISWTAGQAAGFDHADREKTIDESGRELQRRLLEATFTIDGAREQRIEQVTSAAGIRHGSVESGHDRGVNSVFGPLRVSRLAYRNRREANLYPADARWVLPDDPYTLGMRTLVAYHVATGGYGQAQQIIEARTGVSTTSISLVYELNDAITLLPLASVIGNSSIARVNQTLRSLLPKPLHQTLHLSRTQTEELSCFESTQLPRNDMFAIKDLNPAQVSFLPFLHPTDLNNPDR